MNLVAQVFAVCLWLGVVSFGGGLAIVPEMHKRRRALPGNIAA